MSNMRTDSIERRTPVPQTEHVVIVDGLVNVAYRHRSDAVLRARMAQENGRSVVICKREVGTGRWLDTHMNPATQA